MSYQFYEGSMEQGTPIELIEFTQGTNSHFYSTCEQPIVIGNITYRPSPVQRDRVKQTSDLFKNGIRLSFPREDAFVGQFLGFSPEDPTIVTLRRGHWGDPSPEYIVYWKGRVAGSRASDNTIDLDCESVFTSLRRPGLRARFEYGCRHDLYGPRCGAPREAFRVNLVPDAITRGVDVSIPSLTQSPGYFSGGMLVTAQGVARMITNHSGTVVTISRPISGFIPGSVVALYPGCDHTLDSCRRFGRGESFGGFPWIPPRNPFEGSIS